MCDRKERQRLLFFIEISVTDQIEYNEKAKHLWNKSLGVKSEYDCAVRDTCECV